MNQNGFLKPKIKTGFDFNNTVGFGSVNLMNTALNKGQVFSLVSTVEVSVGSLLVEIAHDGADGGLGLADLLVERRLGRRQQLEGVGVEWNATVG